MNSDSPYRLRDENVDRPLLDFLEDESDADENRRRHAEERDRRQAHVLDDLLLAPDRQKADGAPRSDHHQREGEDEVENPVADRLSKGVDRDRVESQGAATSFM